PFLFPQRARWATARQRLPPADLSSANINDSIGSGPHQPDDSCPCRPSARRESQSFLKLPGRQAACSSFSGWTPVPAACRRCLETTCLACCACHPCPWFHLLLDTRRHAPPTGNAGRRRDVAAPGALEDQTARGSIVCS